MRRTVSLIGLVLAIGPAVFAQTSPIGPNQRYLLLSTQRTATMQTELSDAAAQGFRVVAGSPTTGSEMLLFLERATQPPDTYRIDFSRQLESLRCKRSSIRRLQRDSGSRRR